MPEEILHFVLSGQTYAKKNSQKVIYNKWLKRNIVVHSANYNKWEADCRKQMNFKKCYKLGIDYPIILKMHFYVKDKRNRDLSNYLEGPQDLFVDMGLLKDDNYNIVCGHDGTRMFIDKENPRIECWLLKE